MKEDWKRCCKKEIKRLWKECGGSMNIVRYIGKCPECNHFIGLTQTTEKKAKEFLETIKET